MLFCEQLHTPELTLWLTSLLNPPPPPHFLWSRSLTHMNECLSFTVSRLLTQMPNNSFEVWRADGRVRYLNSTRVPYLHFNSYGVVRWVPLLLWSSVSSSWKRENCAHLWDLWGSRVTIHEELLIVSHTDALREVLSSHPGTLWGGSVVCGFAQLDSNQQTFAYYTVVYLLIWIYAIIFLERHSPVSWRRQWHPTPVLLPGKSHGRRSLVGCSLWGR